MILIISHQNLLFSKLSKSLITKVLLTLLFKKVTYIFIFTLQLLPTSLLHSHMSSSYSSSPSLRWWPSTPGASRLLRDKRVFSHWGQIRQSAPVYVSGGLGPASACCLVGGHLSKISQGSSLVETAGLSMGLFSSSSASSSLSLVQPQRTLTLVLWLGRNIWVCFSQLLVGPPRGQPC